jgi:hypothetical protein
MVPDRRVGDAAFGEAGEPMKRYGGLIVLGVLTLMYLSFVGGCMWEKRWVDKWWRERLPVKVYVYKAKDGNFVFDGAYNLEWERTDGSLKVEKVSR